MSGLPGTWREPRRDVEFPYQEALRIWAEAAIPALEKVASTYGDYSTYQELSEILFEKTGVRTRQLLPNWIRYVLDLVLQHCVDHQLPALTALVVNKDTGMVGDGFNAWLWRTGRDSIHDPLKLEEVAAEERLQCYRQYSSKVPVDAKPQLTREYKRSLDRQAPPKPVSTCPNCMMVLPVSGQCGTCD
ncbi:hypothetical protein ACT4S5_13365 [Kocuria oceani]|uniref:hypothetical protein n=1 Tax=Kocuria oceani TaxID=988827 RepID=UPI004036A226